jgi:REP element-mobilizing transposase RayT
MSGDRYFIKDQNAIYFVTFTVVNWLDVFTRANHKHVIVDSLNYCIDHKGLKVHAWCLMSSHLHLIVSAREGFKLSEIIRDFKKHTAKTIIEQIKEEPESRRELLLKEFVAAGLEDKRITTYKFWQESNHAIELERWQTKIMDQKLNYIHYNPVEEGIVESAREYVYSSAKDYSDEKGLVKISLL